MNNDAQIRKDFDELEEMFKNTTKFNMTFGPELDKAVEHIIGLINDSFVLLQNESYASSVFLSITAMEETGKTNYALYLKHDIDTKKKKDPLLNHLKKQSLAVSPVFSIGTRLPNVIGEKRVSELINVVRDQKGLMDLRNNAIYWYTDNNTGNHFPSEYVDKQLAQELLLFSIEAFDDSLVYDAQMSQLTDELFNIISKNYSETEK